MKKVSSICILLAFIVVTAMLAYGIGYSGSSNLEPKTTTETVPTSPSTTALSVQQKEDKEKFVQTETPFEFLLIEQDGYVVVYDNVLHKIYSNTAIAIENLPLDLQKEIQAGKRIKNEGELYSFLENYSS